MMEFGCWVRSFSKGLVVPRVAVLVPALRVVELFCSPARAWVSPFWRVAVPQSLVPFSLLGGLGYVQTKTSGNFWAASSRPG